MKFSADQIKIDTLIIGAFILLLAETLGGIAIGLLNPYIVAYTTLTAAQGTLIFQLVGAGMLYMGIKPALK